MPSRLTQWKAWSEQETLPGKSAPARCRRMMCPVNILTKIRRDGIRSAANRRLNFRALAIGVLVISTACSASAQKKSDPLIGRWELNLAKSHYAGGAEPRKQETFTCQPQGKAISCVI